MIIGILKSVKILLPDINIGLNLYKTIKEPSNWAMSQRWTGAVWLQNSHVYLTH